ncbi:hypothetical protein JDV02_006127 [Purpureocillium takamizusanense]|uniref:Uncharacterized protein n=1 Tax=Purpureocillium takamizusanense TaxID=2060973 RepID=A0A9Q8QK03_9HYPO|nr:uncharacterized protein JDV02_006127 [Purpureocillium takamizusanense]UNI19987.1 hypothetical protein JDV02_006127 [Purpureocillium takamizusanense]
MSLIARHAARCIARLSCIAAAATPRAPPRIRPSFSLPATMADSPSAAGYSRAASTTSWSGSSSSSSSQQQQQQQSAETKSQEGSEQGQDEQRPSGTVAADKALPAPGQGSDVTTLDVSGEGTTVKLDGLGPLVVNRDGTMSRISNWAEMTDIERQNTLRILGKRNKLRLTTLRESQAASDSSSSNN